MRNPCHRKTHPFPHDRPGAQAQDRQITNSGHTRSRNSTRLDPSAERRLVASAQAGDAAARADLLEALRPAIRAIARRYRKSDIIGHTELMQEGAVGVLRALERYDPCRGTPFWAYASWWVRQAMQSLVSQLEYPVVLSDRALRHLALINDAQRRHLQAHRRTPSSKELAEATGLAARHIAQLQSIERSPRSLTEPLDTDLDSAMTLLDQLADPITDTAEQYVGRREAIGAARALGSELDGREREILRARYGFEGEQKTLQQVGKRLGISAERVRQVECTALDKLRWTVHGHP